MLWQFPGLVLKEIGGATAINGTVSLSLKKDDMVLLEKGSRKDNSQYRQLFVSNSN